jgi:hypothetical protein
MPRVYIVSRTSKETDPARILRQLSSETRIAAGDHGSPGQARIVKYENQFVTIQTENPTPGTLVLADSFYPGWRVYVDGKEEQLFRANYFFRGVKLGMGKHLVEFRYEPYWFKVGAVISLLTATLLVLVSILSVIMQRGWVRLKILDGWGLPAAAFRRLS